MDLQFYAQNGFVFSRGLLRSVAGDLQRWTDELPHTEGCEVTYERGSVTRCENFVHLHEGFRRVADQLAEACVPLFGERAALFKEKLNFKPPGGAGFMPHLDHPSLAFYAPANFTSFITVMVAIDDMTSANGCLRVSPGKWTAENAVACVPPEGDPEVGGRAGAIAAEALEKLTFVDIEAEAGDVLFFHGYVPHRSGVNATPHRRRAVFFTYNPASHGEFRTQYYGNLNAIRMKWKQKLYDEMHADYNNDIMAVATIPRVFDRSLYTPITNASAADDTASSSEQENNEEIDALF